MDFNIPSNRPIIQESQSMMNNGGGGNTGYFQRGRKKKEEEKVDIWEEDKFELSSQKDDEDIMGSETSKEGFGHKLVNRMKKFLK